LVISVIVSLLLVGGGASEPGEEEADEGEGN
jgi:hypothetical protein